VGSAHTYDGTSIWTDEPIAAASWNIPMGSYVEVEGVGTYRVADRGMLGSSGWVDIAVYSHAEALALTDVRTVCVLTDP
jgi:3D (Asp-Asp-Asp) domain-containing protein